MARASQSGALEGGRGVLYQLQQVHRGAQQPAYSKNKPFRHVGLPWHLTLGSEALRIIQGQDSRNAFSFLHERQHKSL